MVIVKAGGSQVPPGNGFQAKESGLHSGDSRELWELSEHGQGLLTKEMHLEHRRWVLEGLRCFPPGEQCRADPGVVAVSAEHEGR